ALLSQLTGELVMRPGQALALLGGQARPALRIAINQEHVFHKHHPVARRGRCDPLSPNTSKQMGPGSTELGLKNPAGTFEVEKSSIELRRRKICRRTSRPEGVPARSFDVEKSAVELRGPKSLSSKCRGGRD